MNSSSGSSSHNTEQQDTVAQHYNRRPERGLEHRRESPIFQLKQFNNWVKSVLINQYVSPGNTIFDLCCGKGGDLLKFHNARIKSYVGADIASESVKAASERYNNSQHQIQPEKRFNFDATFLVANCIKTNLGSVLDDRSFDCVSCQFALHYSFESEDNARTFLVNASSSLRIGGHFLVTCPDAYVLIKKLRAQPENVFTISNDVYRAVFQSKHFDAHQPFGNRYQFYLSDAIDECPEFLVPPRTLVELAREYGLQCVLSKNFHEFWESFSDREELKYLTEKVYRLKSGDMTPDQWEAIYLYRVFVFKKVSENEVSEDEESNGGGDQEQQQQQQQQQQSQQQEAVIVPDARSSRFKEVQPTDIITVA